MQQFKTRLRRAFTITELVIVIAVIAILAAVLIPSFIYVVNKANQSSDIQAVRNMNIALSASDGDGKPTDADAAIAILRESGINADGYAPLTEGYAAYWLQEENRIVLFDTERGSVVFPEEYSSLTFDETNWFTLQTTGTRQGFTADGKGSFSYDSGKLIKALEDTDGVLTIPSEINGESVTTVPSFDTEVKQKIKKAVISEGITSIADKAFQGGTGTNEQLNSTLEAIVLPSTLTSLGQYTFGYCTALKEIVIPDGVTTLDTVLYNCTALTTVTISEKLTTIKAETFQGCTSLRTFRVGENGAENVIDLSHVEAIWKNAFNGCTSIEKVVFGAKTQFSSANNFSAFSGCSSLKEVDMSKATSLKQIPYSTFKECSALETVTLPSGLTKIGGSSSSGQGGAFQNCNALKTITIPTSVTQLGLNAFNGCNSLNFTVVGSNSWTVNGSTLELNLSNYLSNSSYQWNRTYRLTQNILSFLLTKKASRIAAGLFCIQRRFRKIVFQIGLQFLF